jgi:membrane protein DedA with SNARE-associated domain
VSKFETALRWFIVAVTAAYAVGFWWLSWATDDTTVGWLAAGLAWLCVATLNLMLWVRERDVERREAEEHLKRVVDQWLDEWETR